MTYDIVTQLRSIIKVQDWDAVQHVIISAADEIERLRKELAAPVPRTTYGVRLHERIDESDEVLGTVMYTTRGDSGPWFDMVTGHPDWCWEVADALVKSALVDEYRRIEDQSERLKYELEQFRSAGNALAEGIRSGRWDDALDEWDDINSV